MAAKDGKRPLVLHLKSGSRPTSPSISTFVFTLVVGTGVDPLDDLGRNVSRPGRFVFHSRHSRHARLDIFRHLVWTRSGFGCLLPRLSPFEYGGCWASSATAAASSSSTRAEGPLDFPLELAPRAPAGRGVFGSTARTPVWARCEPDTLVPPSWSSRRNPQGAYLHCSHPDEAPEVPQP